MMHSLTSMTGYGQAQGEGPLGLFMVELRTVNNRFQDISVTLPRELSALEMPLRLLLKPEIPRGRIDCRVRFTAAAGSAINAGLNVDMARAWVMQLRQLEELRLGVDIPLAALLQLPGVVEGQGPAGNEAELFEQIKPVVAQAVEALNRERRREGEGLGREMLAQTERLAQLAEEIESRKDEVVVRYREKLRARLTELEQDLKTQLDPGRIEVEIMLYADRLDISEELARLKVHLTRFRDLLTAPQKEPAGKNIEFLLQEIGREINTTCSKARDTAVISLGLEMKSVLEKLKEQSANVQ